MHTTRVHSDDYIVHIEKFKAPTLDTIKIWILSLALNLERKTLIKNGTYMPSEYYFKKLATFSENIVCMYFKIE